MSALVPRRRVLIVGHSLSGGGAERFTSTLLTHLNRERFEPFLATLTSDQTYSLPADVPHTKLGYRGIGRFFPTVWRLRKTIAELLPDVILSTFDLPTLFVGWALGRSRRWDCRWVARLGLAVDRPAFSWLDALSRRFVDRFYLDVDRFVANSQGLADDFAKNYPFAAELVVSIPNCVDSEQLHRLAAEESPFCRDKNRPLLVTAGRLHRQKRYDVLLDAFAQLREAFHPQLWILGEGPLRTPLERQIAQRGWQNDVRLCGYQANPFPLLAQGDLFLLASDFEGMPNALLEAQTLGLPAVATRAKFGPDEIIQSEQTGLLVPCGDATAMAEACRHYLTDEANRLQAGQAARASIAERFAVRPIVTRWEEILATV